MGSEGLESQANDESTYRIIRLPARDLPHKYESFFFAKFLRTQKFQNPMFKLCDSNSFFKNYPPFIHSILARPQAYLSFAILPDEDKDVVIGFSLMEPNILHYVYVIRELRRQGIAKALVNKPFDTVTHMTNTGLTIFSKLNNVRLDPWA